jgi:hypothetical protein
MFYHPHFCCHCGEKIVRAKWTPLTSRRFCEFCAVEQKQHDLIPRAAAVILLLVGAAGFTAYLSSGRSAAVSDAPQPARVRGPRTDSSEKERNSNTEGNSARSNIAPAPGDRVPQALPGNGTEAESKQRPSQRNSSTEPVYYCGAMTKKGTACTRRVKAPGRCWQHLGQPAMNSLQN